MAWLLGDGSTLGDYDYGTGAIVIPPMFCDVEMPSIILEGSLSLEPLECDVLFDTITLPDTIVIAPIYVDAEFPTISLNGDKIYYSNNLVVF